MRRLRRLIQKRSLRWSEGVCVLEGPDLVTAALADGIEFEAIFVASGSSNDQSVAPLVTSATRQGVRIFELDPIVLEKVADAQSPQPVLAIVRMPLVGLDQIATNGLVLVLHEMRDPGNVGTVIRSSDAAGVSGVVITGQSVDPFNPKTLRATAGSIFHVPVAVGELGPVLQHFSKLGMRSLATVVTGGDSHRTIDLASGVIVVIGNEAQGLAPGDVELCDGAITIAMAGRSESLNAGVAASLIAFESMWQRRDVTPAAPRRSLEES